MNSDKCDNLSVERIPINQPREKDGLEDEENSDDIKSKAVVKFSTAVVPAPFTLLQCNTNLNLPPPNWLSNSVAVYGVQPGILTRSGFSSFSMAHKFPDCVGVVDVVSDAENIKKLMKMSHSSSPVSLMVHRVEKTLLVDEFDLKKVFLASEQRWEWFRTFFERVSQSMKVKPEKVIEYKDNSRTALQQKRLISKFLYHSLVSSPDSSEDSGEEPAKADPNIAIPLPFVGEEPPLPEPPSEEEVPDPTFTHTFARNVVWNFEDIQMLLGTDIPIFGGDTHPCVSLRLRDMSKPINVLTGIDYWLDNLMCNVPEVVMCYHLNGIVQKYELIKTEDLPHLPNSKFSPKVIRDIAQNILSFLKFNATKAGHTYWLFKGRDDDVVKLYDLTSLCTDVLDEGQTPFTVPVAMLLYRVARNMKHHGGRRQETTICTLLKNCVSLLPDHKYPEIATSAHYMLADIHVPSDLDPLQPNLSNNTSEDVHESEEDEDDYSAICSMNLSSMLEPLDEPLASPPPPPTPLSSDIATRCNDALNHVIEGLRCLRTVEVAEPPMAQTAEPIPMSYHSLNRSDLKKTSTETDNPKTLLCKPPADSVSSESWSWGSHLKALLCEKTILIYLTLLEHFYCQEEYGTCLQYAGIAMKVLKINSLVKDSSSTEITLLSKAGDALFMIATRGASKMQKHDENYRNYSAQDLQLCKLLKLDDISSPLPSVLDTLETLMMASSACYSQAASLATIDDQRTSFHRRIGNIKNELGVFYMNQAYALIQKNCNEDFKKVQEFLDISANHLETGIAAFQRVEDAANLALLYSNTGRLMRLRAHLNGSENATRKELAQQERIFYNKAISNYHLAIEVLGERSANPGVWDSIYWELSTAYYTLASLLQDYPAGNKTQEEAERELTDTLHKALKYCDLDTNGARLPIYQFRSAEIHHRLASLHHSQFRRCGEEGRKKHILQLSKLHYDKASKLLIILEYPTELLKVEMKRVGLAEALAEGCQGASSKSKHLLQALEHIVEAIPMMEQLVGNPSDESADKAEIEEQIKLLSLMLERLQFILLTLTKLAVKKGSDKKGGNQVLYKKLYSLALKNNPNLTEENVNVKALASSILTVAKEIRGSLKLPADGSR